MEYPKYLAPSAPTSFVYSDGHRINAPDGILQATTDQEQKELLAARKAGTIYDYVPKAEVKPAQQPPKQPIPVPQSQVTKTS